MPDPGLHLLYEPPELTSVTADIVFVHGLGGGHLSTWSEGDICWPRDLLKNDLPTARIFSNEYDSKIIKLAEATSRTSIAGHAETLLNDLSRVRRSLKEPRPIVFVCHSLGGLLAKQALIRSSEYYHNHQTNHVHLGSVFVETRGIVFLGTPHRGSGKATLGKIAAKAGGVLGANPKILKALERDSDLLEQQRSSFDSIRTKFLTVCLFEELSMGFIGMIVPEASACIDGPDILREHLPGGNHRTMAKFSSSTQRGYRIVTDYIQRCLARGDIQTDQALPFRPESIDPAVARIVDQCLLNSFGYAEMHERYSNIDNAHKSVTDAHKSTFDWVFAPEGSGFVDWLESDEPLFWINGKAGSGKSTLMKFISEDPRLTKHLNMRNPNRDFILAKFFFWSAGSKQQKSQEGLLKAILYTLLAKRHPVIRVLLPEQWTALYELAAEMRHEELIKTDEEDTRKTRRSGFNALISSKADRRVLGRLYALADLRWTTVELLKTATDIFTAMTTKTFLLIDGLDEFEGEGELGDVVSLIKSWSQQPNVKVCVSTRPWTIFETNFGKDMYPSLRLQDLTHSDIALFVQDFFESSPLMKILQDANPNRCPDFHQAIVSKAEGVFLWVRLVVKSLIDGLGNGDELSTLQDRVAELPADLESLYRHMLQRIPQRYLGTSARLFSIMGACEKAPSSLLLWHVGERGDALFGTALDDRTKTARCYQVHLRLMSKCAGLLELRTGSGSKSNFSDQETPDLTRVDEGWSFSTQQHYIHSTVHYMHRTTRDFLHQREIKELMGERLKGSSFDNHSWLAIHTFVAVYELRKRIVRIQRTGCYDEWEMFGFERREKSEHFERCLTRATNENVKEMLRHLSQQLDELIKQEQTATSPVTDELKRALRYIDC